MVNTFYGKYRTRQLGIKSATSNLAVVLGSFFVGFLIKGDNWHLPFLVYLAVLLPLIFCFWIKNIPGVSVTASSYSKVSIPSTSEYEKKEIGVKSEKKEIDIKKVWGLIGNNVSFSFIAMAVVIYLPQIIESYGWQPKVSGEIIAVFFIFVLFSGFILLPFIRLLKHFTFFGLALFLISGLAFITFIKAPWALYVGSALVGISFGFFQPFIYDKTSYTVLDSRQTIKALSYVLTALYMAIAVEPFVIKGICSLFKINDENHFVFLLSFFMGIAYAFIAFIFRKKFAFSVEKEYISEPDVECI